MDKKTLIRLTKGAKYIKIKFNNGETKSYFSPLITSKLPVCYFFAISFIEIKIEKIAYKFVKKVRIVIEV